MGPSISLALSKPFQNPCLSIYLSAILGFQYAWKENKLEGPWFSSESMHAIYKISREFASCSCFIIRLSDQSSRNHHNIGLIALDFSNKRDLYTVNFSDLRNYHSHNFSEPSNYHSQKSSEPGSRRLTSNCQVSDRSFKLFSDETYPILQSSSFQHWFKNWQEKRKHKLTASTFGGAVGFWPCRRVQLWLEKLGAIKPFTGDLTACWNNIREEEALERYKLITGNDVFFPEFQVYGRKNPEDDWLAASPDGVVVHGLSSGGVLEIKCPFFNGDMSLASPWSRVPLYYIPQAQGLMEIMDCDWMDFYVWTVNGSSLFRLYRDEEYWNVLKRALSDFWFKHVLPAREMCSKNMINNPLTELKALKPEPRHELCGPIIYESRRIAVNSKLLIREIHGKLQN